MTHDDAQELLALMATGDLTGDQQAELDAHLEGCEECREELAELQTTYELLAEGLTGGMPAELDEMHRAKVLDTGRQRPKLLSLRMLRRIAAVVVLGFVLWMAWHTIERTRDSRHVDYLGGADYRMEALAPQEEAAQEEFDFGFEGDEAPDGNFRRQREQAPAPSLMPPRVATPEPAPATIQQAPERDGLARRKEKKAEAGKHAAPGRHGQVSPDGPAGGPFDPNSTSYVSSSKEEGFMDLDMTEQVAEDGDVVSSGPVGGPFKPQDSTYTLENTGGKALQLKGADTQTWVSTSSTSGNLTNSSEDRSASDKDDASDVLTFSLGEEEPTTHTAEVFAFEAPAEREDNRQNREDSKQLERKKEKAESEVLNEVAATDDDEFSFGDAYDMERSPDDSPDVSITMDMENIPLGEVIRYICEGAGLSYRIEPHAIVIADQRVALDGMETRFYPIDTDDLKQSLEGMVGLDGSRPSLEDYMQTLGVQFPEGARVSVDPRTDKLIMRNTADNLRRFEASLTDLELSEPPPPRPENEAMHQKLNTIIVPRIAFEDASIENVLTFLKERSKDLDADGEGVNFFLHLTEKVEVDEREAATSEPTQPETSPEPEPTPAPPEETPLPPIPTEPPPPVNPFVMAGQDALSTFALEADTASYAIARRFIRQGYRPPPALVRMEEFINAFDYHYPQQSDRVFSIHASGAPAPFGQDLTLLKIGVKGKVLGRDGMRPAHLMFVIDASGSMGRDDRLPLVKHALALVLDQLSPQDWVSIIAYGRQAQLLAERVPASRKAEVRRAIESLESGTSTNLLAGVKAGYELAARHFAPERINRILLCSDGVANLGPSSVDELMAQIEDFRRQGITFTSVGVGSGSYDDRMLEQLANQGDGNYVYIDSRETAQQVFGEELAATLQTIARNAKIQVAFNPERVRRYRLIGYENRDVADEDFRNDAVDAGEIGSGQSATALYELELLPGEEGLSKGDLGTVYVRYENVDSGEIEEISSRLTEELIRPRSASEDPAFCLAAGVAEFAEVLRQSEHAAQGDLQGLEAYLVPVANAWPLDRRVQELLRLVQQAQGLPVAQ